MVVDPVHENRAFFFIQFDGCRHSINDFLCAAKIETPVFLGADCRADLGPSKLAFSTYSYDGAAQYFILIEKHCGNEISEHVVFIGLHDVFS